jgi:hypothetical protein
MSVKYYFFDGSGIMKKFGVWSLEFGVWSLEFGVWSFSKLQALQTLGTLGTFLRKPPLYIHTYHLRYHKNPRTGL